MKKLKKVIIALFVLIISENMIAQSLAKVYADGNETTVVVPNTQNYKLEFPVNMEEAAKTFNPPTLLELQYHLNIGGGEESLGLDHLYSNNHTYSEAKNWKKFAKQGGVVSIEIDERDINHALERLKKYDWPEKDHKIKVWIEALKNIRGEKTVISEAWITIPLSLKSSFIASEESDVMKSFQTGQFSDMISESNLNTTIENYMEKKWPDEDIITVNVQSLIYTNVSATNYRFEGTYISQKNGVCKYNTCLGKGTKTESRFAISVFNSVDAAQKISCENAEKLKNR
jgi:hypothetical protein